MAQSIEPYRQSVKKSLKDRTYYIDFYQREYVWNKRTVEILLDDIFEVFEQSYLLHENADMTPEVMDTFNWYYMNVFITNKIGNKTYIVDGQQRLSTLTLICVKLYHLTDDSALKGLLESCVYGQEWKTPVYRIDNDKRKRAMDAILDNTKLKNPMKVKRNRHL